MGVESMDQVFGKETGALDVARVFEREIRGSVVLITGVSPTSIGASLALAISSQQPHLLILASRTASKIEAVTKDILKSYPKTRIQQVIIDLSNLDSVRKAAAEVRTILAAEGRELDILFNNAGINFFERRLNNEGVELQFATNYLGPWLLTNLLLPLILPTSPSSAQPSQPDQAKRSKRIINTSSEAHRISPVRFSDINQTPGVKVAEGEEPRRGLPKGILKRDGGYEPSIAYAQSKTAQVLHAVGLNKRLRDRRVGSLAVMPGTIMTEIVRDLDQHGMEGLINTVDHWKTADQGAASLVVAAFDPALDNGEAIYIDDCQPKRPSKWASDPEKAERLWGLSEEMVGEKFEFGMEKERESKL